jgi:FkbM family methyltransferase
MQPAAPRPVAFVLAATDHGPMILCRNDYHMLAPGQGMGVGYQLLASSSFDAQEVRGVLELLAMRRTDFGDGVVALDCGANIGVHTIEWARAMSGWGRVMAFEAQERIFYALAGNIAVNNCGNATATWAALGAQAGVMKIPELDFDRPASFGSLELRPRAEGVEFVGQVVDYAALVKAVRMLAIDDLALERLDLIKIDVEGMELEVLAGAAQSIRRHRPMMVVETLKSGSQPILDWLAPLGYRTWQWGINLLAIHEGDPSSRNVAIV